MLWQKVSNPW